MTNHTGIEWHVAAAGADLDAARRALICTYCGRHPLMLEVAGALGRRVGDACLRPECRRREVGTLRAVVPGEPTVGQVYMIDGVGVVTVDHVGDNGLVNGAQPAAVYRLPGQTSSWGHTTLADWPRLAVLLHDPHHDRNTPPVRALVDAIRILGPRHERAAYYLGRQLHAAYYPEQVEAGNGPVFDNVETGCVCGPVAAAGAACLCTHDERVLRAYSEELRDLPPMTLPQREWCISEAVWAGEGAYQRADLVDLSDADLAREVLSAWRDYVNSQF